MEDVESMKRMKASECLKTVKESFIPNTIPSENEEFDGFSTSENLTGFSLLG